MLSDSLERRWLLATKILIYYKWFLALSSNKSISRLLIWITKISACVICSQWNGRFCYHQYKTEMRPWPSLFNGSLRMEKATVFIVKYSSLGMLIELRNLAGKNETFIWLDYSMRLPLSDIEKRITLPYKRHEKIVLR